MITTIMLQDRNKLNNTTSKTNYLYKLIMNENYKL